MENKHHVFVYGTLRWGQGNWKWALKDKAKFLGFAHTKGKMYHLGGFPGVRLSDDPEDLVWGEVYEVDDATLKTLDRLEGVDHGFYNRVETVVTYRNEHAGERPEKVYIYEYGNQPNEHNRILTGDWVHQHDNGEE